ncbi:unnamed protein product, partial [Effrenium voratum]
AGDPQSFGRCAVLGPAGGAGVAGVENSRSLLPQDRANVEEAFKQRQAQRKKQKSPLRDPRPARLAPSPARPAARPAQASIQIQTEVGDPEAFSTQFLKAAAEAAGVDAHRIRIKAIRPQPQPQPARAAGAAGAAGGMAGWREPVRLAMLRPGV